MQNWFFFVQTGVTRVLGTSTSTPQVQTPKKTEEQGEGSKKPPTRDRKKYLEEVERVENKSMEVCGSRLPRQNVDQLERKNSNKDRLVTSAPTPDEFKIGRRATPTKVCDLIDMTSDTEGEPQKPLIGESKDLETMKPFHRGGSGLASMGELHGRENWWVNDGVQLGSSSKADGEDELHLPERTKTGESGDTTDSDIEEVIVDQARRQSFDRKRKRSPVSPQRFYGSNEKNAGKKAPISEWASRKIDSFTEHMSGPDSSSKTNDTIASRMLLNRRLPPAEKRKEATAPVAISSYFPPADGKMSSSRSKSRHGTSIHIDDGIMEIDAEPRALNSDESVHMESCLDYLRSERKCVRPYQFSKVALVNLVRRLLKDEYLHDEIINNTIQLIASDSKAQSTLLLNTFWYEKVRDASHDEAQNWIRKALRDRTMKHILQVCAPVNISNTHWVLAVFDVTKHETSIWDPAGGSQADIANHVNQFFGIYGQALGLDTTKECRCVASPLNLPVQGDSYNCGLFVILYIIHLCLRGPGEPCTFLADSASCYKFRFYILAWILSCQDSELEDSPLMLFLDYRKTNSRHDFPVGEKESLRIILLSLLLEQESMRGLMDLVMVLIRKYSGRRCAYMDSSWYEQYIKVGKAQEAARLAAESTLEGDMINVQAICAVVPVMNEDKEHWLLVDMLTHCGRIRIIGGEGLNFHDPVKENFVRFLSAYSDREYEEDLQPVVSDSPKLSALVAVINALHFHVTGSDELLVPDLTLEKAFAYQIFIMRWIVNLAIDDSPYFHNRCR